MWNNSIPVTAMSIIRQFPALSTPTRRWPSVGQTEQALSEQGIPVKTGTFYFKANGRALALGDTDGLVKVIAHSDTDRMLGVHIIGPRAGDLLAEAVVAMEYGASSEDLARAFHAHPTAFRSDQGS